VRTRAGHDPETRAAKDPGALRRAVDPWRVAFYGLLIAAVLAASGWVVLGPNVLVVRHEKVVGNRSVPAAEVLAAAAIRRGTPLRSVNTGAVAHRIERIPQVLAVAVDRSWPDTIVITIRLRTPALAVAEASHRYALIDGHGVTVRLSPRRPAGMPLLLDPAAHVPGSPGVRSAVTVLQELPHWLRGLIETVTAPAANDVSFGLHGGITVVWGGPALTAKKTAELAVLLEQTQDRYYDVSDPTTAVAQR
jgi:cell division protein FtsQ